MNGAEHGDWSGLLTTSEVAARFQVAAATVRRWVRLGKITTINTPGGRPRFRVHEINALLEPRDEV